jgi:uncharacterized protein related to proFAR isomerase
MSEEVQNMIGTLIDQLKENNQNAEKVKKIREPLKKEDLEQFIRERGAELIEDSLDMVATVKDFIVSAPNAEDVEALSGLINATAAAMDTLNKINIQDKRSETSVKLKEMDIKAKKELQEAEAGVKLLTTREEMLKILANNAKPIQAEIVENKLIN